MKKTQRSRKKITKRFAIFDITRFRVIIFGMYNWSDLTPVHFVVVFATVGRE